MKKCLNRQVAARVSRHCKGCVFAALQKCEALWFSYPMVDVWWISQSCCRRFSTWRVHTPWLTRYLDSQRPESDFEAGKQILKTHGSHPLKGQVWLPQPRLDDEVNYVSSFIRGGIDPIWLSWDKPPATLAFPTKNLQLKLSRYVSTPRLGVGGKRAPCTAQEKLASRQLTRRGKRECLGETVGIWNVVRKPPKSRHVFVKTTIYSTWYMFGVELYWTHRWRITGRHVWGR